MKQLVRNARSIHGITLTLCLMAAAAVAVPALAQSSAFWQWTAQGFPTQASALIEMSVSGSDPKPSHLIDTTDPTVTTFGTPTPYVVFRWQFVDLWAGAPEHFSYSITGDLHTAGDLLNVYCARINPWRKCGIATLAPAPFAGEHVVWQTTP